MSIVMDSEEEPLLPHRPPASSTPSHTRLTATNATMGLKSGLGTGGVTFLHGKTLVAAITSVCASGFLLFGYDQGCMSGVVISKYWLAQMGHPSTIMVSTMTALYDVGAVFGALGAAFTGEVLGRKRTLLLGTAILSIGSILMGTSNERVQFMVARILTGVGIGYITSVTPVYQSEISPAAQRGWHLCSQLTTMLFGLMVAYWINYGFYFHPGGIQWRFPLLFQLVFATYILIVTPWLPDTPRWLLRHNPVEEVGTSVLARLRNSTPDSPLVQQEKDDIMEAIRLETKEEGSWTDLFKDGGIKADKRFYLALGIQFMQQMSGINIVTYYAPTLFTTSLNMTQELSLLMGCFLQLWYILASFVTWYTIDRIGRRKLFISMALGMCLVLVLEAICVRIGGASASIAAVVFVFLFEACFTWGWMATVWVYPPEILPLRTRAKGAGCAAAADFLGNFLVVEITPPALKNIGYKTYIIFAVFNVVNALIVWLFYPETGGIPLESVDLIFLADPSEGNHVGSQGRYERGHGGSEGEKGGGWARKIQWDVVGRADRLRREEKEGRRRRRVSDATLTVEHGMGGGGTRGIGERKLDERKIEALDRNDTGSGSGSS